MRCPRGAVVVGVDGSAQSHTALTAAIEFARLKRRPLHVLHAYDLTPVYLEGLPDPGERAAVIRRTAQEVADRAQAIVATAAPDLDVTIDLVAADPREILQKASESASLVVVGSRGMGGMRSLPLGSVSAWVSTRAVSPTLVVRQTAGQHKQPARVMVGADANQVSASATEFAFEQASLRGQPLTLVHCFDETGAADDDDAEERLAVAESMAGLCEKYVDVQVDVELGRGSAAVYLAQASERASLLVVGSRFRSASAAMLFGAVSRAVVEHATCSVAVVPNHFEAR